MFELPEFVTLAGQINATLAGKTIQHGSLGNSPHKFVWYNRRADEFAALTQGKMVGSAHARGKWLFIPLDPGYVLLFGECGGRILHHPAGAKLPEKYHLWLAFTDGSSLTAMTQMWGAMELYESGQELDRQYIKDMRPTPTEPEFTYGYFSVAHRLAPAGRKTERQRTPDARAAHSRAGKRHQPGHPFPSGPAPQAPDRRAERGSAARAVRRHRVDRPGGHRRGRPLRRNRSLQPSRRLCTADGQ